MDIFPFGLKWLITPHLTLNFWDREGTWVSTSENSMILTKLFPADHDPDDNTDHVDVQARYDDDEEDDGPSADPQLEGGMPLPIRWKID